MDQEHNFTEEELASIFQLTEEDKALMARMFPGHWKPATRVTGQQLMEMNFPPVEWVIPGIIPAGYTILAAPPKAGKSWLVLDAAIAISTGQKLLGAYQVEKPRPVLYLALEDTLGRIKSRLEVLDYQANHELTIIINIEEEDYGDVITQWLEGKEQLRPLIIVDTLQKVRPAGDSTYGSDYQFSASFKKLIDPIPGGGLWAVHHTRQRTLGVPTGDFLESVSGTSGITGAADTIAVLARERHELEAILAVTGRDVEEQQYALQFDEGRWIIDPHHPHPEKEQPKNDPVAYVKAHGEASYEAIRAQCPGITGDATQRRLKRAVDRGEIRRVGHLYYSN